MANKKISLRPFGPIGSNVIAGTIFYDLIFGDGGDHYHFEFDCSQMRGTAAAIAYMQTYIDGIIGAGNCEVSGTGWNPTPINESQFDIDFIGIYANFDGDITSQDGPIMSEVRDVIPGVIDVSDVDGNTKFYDFSQYVGGTFEIDGTFFPYNVVQDLTTLQAFLDLHYNGIVATAADGGGLNLALTGTVTFPVLRSTNILVEWTDITAVTLRENSVLEATTVKQNQGLTLANLSLETL